MSPFTMTSRLLMMLAALAPTAAAACEWAPNAVSLGSVPTQRVRSGGAITGSGVFPFTCSGKLVEVAGLSPSLKVSFAGAVDALTLKSGGHAIPYQVYLDANYSSVPTTGLVLLEVLDLHLLGIGTSGPDIRIPVYLRIQTGANIPAGTYTDTLQMLWDVKNICVGVDLFGVCLGSSYEGVKIASMPITLAVTNSCTITAPTVNFGSAPLPAGFPSVSQSIELSCSQGAVYTVGMSLGNHAVGSRRRMASGGSHLAYNIFKASNDVWGPLGGERAPAPGAPDGITPQSIPYTARVYTDQGSPPAGTYTDNVVVDVAW